MNDEEYDLSEQYDTENRIGWKNEYGLGSNLTGFLNYYQTPLDKEFERSAQTYLSYGVRMLFNGVILKLNRMDNLTENGHLYDVEANTAIGDASLKLNYSRSEDFFSDNSYYDQGSNARKSFAEATLTDSLYNLNYKLNVEREVEEDDDKIYTFSNNLSTNINGIGLGNNFDWQHYTTRSDDVIDGDAYIRGRYRGVMLRGEAYYSINPDTDLDRFSVVADKTFNNYNMQFRYTQELSTTTDASFYATISKKYEKFMAGIDATSNTTGDFSIGARLNFSFGFDDELGTIFSSENLASTASLKARAYIDNDYNEERSEAEELVEGVSIKHSGKSYKTTMDDPVLITNLSPYVDNNIRIEEASIEDPLLEFGDLDYVVRSTPGKLSKFDYSLKPISEITGSIYAIKNGRKLPGSQIPLHLIDSKGKIIQKFKTDYDGFYVFDKIRNGRYDIVVDPKFLKEFKLNKIRRAVNIRSSDFYEVRDVILRAK